MVSFFFALLTTINVRKWLLTVPAHLKYILMGFNVQFNIFPKLWILSDFANLSSINMSYLNIPQILKLKN